MDTAFTLGGSTVSNRGGFADLLFRMEANYLAGRRLGLPLYYEPAASARSGLDAFDICGFNAAYRSVADRREGAGAAVPVAMPDVRALAEPDQLAAFDRALASRMAAVGPGALVSFTFTAPRRHHALHVIRLLGGQPNAPDFRARFDPAGRLRRDDKNRSYFRTGSVRVALHVRRGDRAVVPLADGTLVAPWGTRKVQRRPAKIARRDEAAVNQVSDPVYGEMLAVVIDALGARAHEVVLVSEGFARAASFVADQAAPAGFDDTTVAAVSARAAELDDEMARFYRAAGADRIVIGEQAGALGRVIRTLADADILISIVGGFAGGVCRYFDEPDRNKIGILNGGSLIGDLPAYYEAHGGRFVHLLWAGRAGGIRRAAEAVPALTREMFPA